MEAPGLTIGTVIGQRFVVERIVGAGGMGIVCRATDLYSDVPVALKLMLHDSSQPQELERFQREIRSLAELRHPAIIAYVAHGLGPEGQPFLAMEWLDGVDLGDVLRRRRLDVEESLGLAVQIADALAAAHRQHVVHRDIKPSNIFLRDGAIERATLIDFGIARRLHGERPGVTRTGVLLGTPEYMAPEQARGQTDIGPAADVFSLGCVLFECLTGRPPFTGDHVAAVLAKILFDEAPRLRELRPELPRRLDELVARMLAADPQARPRDGAAVLTELRDLPTLGELPLPARTIRPRDADGEQHYFSLLLAAETIALAERPTLRAVTGRRTTASLSTALRELGAEVQALIDGSLAAAFPPVSGLAPGDRAALALRCALLVKERNPNHRVAVTTGRGVLGEGIPRGQGIDRAAALVRAPVAPELVRTDRLTAELCGTRFEFRELGPDLFTVASERTSLDESRPLLGRPTPCLGREQELGALEATLAACVDEECAGATLVVAPAGMGKSRLRHEFLRRAAARFPALDVMLGRGDLMRAGAPHAVIAAALRQRWGLRPGDDPAQLALVRSALAREIGPGEHERALEFLAELCGVPVTSPGAPLLAARRDPKLMLAQQTAAFVELVRAACARAPVLLVLEDMQWGDAPSFALVDAALRELVELPFMVVGFGRPEIDERFPNLWRERGPHALRLGGLSRRASERLIRHALGADLEPDLVARLLDQAGGSPLYLEELIRAVAAGKPDTAPDTVLAMLHARLLRFEPGLRRVLRAAACFGTTFWRGGVAALLTDAHGDAAELAESLRILGEHELIVRHPDSRFAGDDEYAFRHALLREAAYTLSSEDDRARDHLLAAEFLEAAGERDPRVLAGHWERAGERERAVGYIVDATDQSYLACDSDGALALIQRGLACEPVGELRARLHAVAAWVHTWRVDWPESTVHAVAAVEHGEPGGLSWCNGMANQINLALFGDQEARFRELTERYLATDPMPEAEPTYVSGIATFVGLYGMLGCRLEATAAMRRMHAIGDRHPHDSAVCGWMAIASCDYYRNSAPDPAAQVEHARVATRLFSAAADRRLAFFARVIQGQAECETGLVDAGEADLRAAVADAREMHDRYYDTMAVLHLAAALAAREEPAASDEAVALVRDLLAAGIGNPGYSAWAHAILAQIHLQRHELAAADEHVEHAMRAPSTNVLRIRVAATLRMRLLLARDALDDALALARDERDCLDRYACGHAEPSMRLAIAEVLHRAGDIEPARAVLAGLIDRLTARAGLIPDPEWRARFLTAVPLHRDALALARAWDLAPP